MFKRIAMNFHNLQFKTRLTIIFLTMNILTIVIFSSLYYYTDINNYERLVKLNALDIIARNNKVMDMFLSNVQESINRFSYDNDVYEALLNMDSNNEYSMIRTDKIIKDALKRYFDRDKAESLILVTGDYLFGMGQWNNEKWEDSKLFKTVLKANGGFVWLPTYVFDEELDLNYMKDVEYSYKLLFSCAKQLTVFTSKEEGSIHHLPEDMPKPTLLINFNKEYFSEFFNENTPVEGTKYLIVNKEGRYVYSSSDNKIPQSQIIELLNRFNYEDKGEKIISSYKDGGKEFIVCFNKSNITDWTTIALVDKSVLVNISKQNMGQTYFILCILMIIIILISVIVSSYHITKPLNSLKVAFEKTRQGEFGTMVNVVGDNDIDQILKKFNVMSKRIQTLINENYKVKLHDKEAQIRALNFQLQPHFLYNTLNLVNCMAIENNQMETSKIMLCLSNMLRYTAHNDKELGILKEEIEWLKQYFYIMNCRFEGKINVNYELETSIMDTQVPRLCLQPFIENSFKHGFKDMDEISIEIIVKKKRDKRIVIIKDNGVGMSDRQIREINAGGHNNLGINNVMKRLELLYGNESYLIFEKNIPRGVIVKIIMPF